MYGERKIQLNSNCSKHQGQIKNIESDRQLIDTFYLRIFDALYYLAYGFIHAACRLNYLKEKISISH